MAEVSWAGPMLRAEKSIRLAGEYIEDRKTRAGVIELLKAQAALNEVMVHILEERTQ